MSWQLGTPNTGDALAALDPNSVRILWQRAIDKFEQNEDYWSKYEGVGKDSPIRVINDTSVGAGLKFRITARAGYYGPGKNGDDLFNNQSDFETDVINSYEVDADYIRNATSLTERTDEYMGMRGELADGQVEELGNWMGREKSARMFMTFRLSGNPDNYLYSNGKTSQDVLLSSDGMSYNNILLMGQVLKPKGGKPCAIATRNGVKVRKFCVVGTTPSLYSLKQDPVYQNLLQQAAPREKYDENPLWVGGYMDIDGHRIDEYTPIDHDGYGPVGCGFSARAFLGTAITAGTAAFAITGGGSAAAAALTNIQYFKFFSNFAFVFTKNNVFVPGSTQKYLLIVNPSNAPVDPGKVGMYGWTTGNNGNTITINQWLAPVVNGPVAQTTVGSVTWNTGVWGPTSAFPTGRHTQTHPIGATIVECNAKGVPIGHTVMFGQMAALRGYGSMRNKRAEWKVDGDFETRKYITSVFGQALRKNVNNVFPGFVDMISAITYPELGLPLVTS